MGYVETLERHVRAAEGTRQRIGSTRIGKSPKNKRVSRLFPATTYSARLRPIRKQTWRGSLHFVWQMKNLTFQIRSSLGSISPFSTFQRLRKSISCVFSIPLDISTPPPPPFFPLDSKLNLGPDNSRAGFRIDDWRVNESWSASRFESLLDMVTIKVSLRRSPLTLT